ncbi:MAG: OmpH family outer membrane protein [Candidatus Zixiibacteriota bacterium]
MLSIKRTILLALFAFFALSVVGSVVNAQGLKIGFVRDDLIQTRYTAWQRAQEQWDLEQKAWDDEAMAKKQEIDDLIVEYDKQKLILSEDKKKEKEAAIRAKQEALDAYTRQVYGPGGTAETKNKTLLEPLLENVNRAIEAVALEGDYDVIFTMQSGLGYIKEGYDVTEKVLEYLEKQEE